MIDNNVDATVVNVVNDGEWWMTTRTNTTTQGLNTGAQHVSIRKM